jgi:hypothetical protein
LSTIGEGSARGGPGPLSCFSGRLLAAVLVLVALAGCGPRYATEYALGPPPQTPEARACVSACEVSRLTCQQTSNDRYGQCVQTAQMQQLLCQQQQQIDALSCNRSGPQWKGYPCYIRSCQAPYCWRDDRACGDIYRACYAGCGGTVTPQTVCVAGCPPAAPPAAAPPAPAPLTPPATPAPVP